MYSDEGHPADWEIREGPQLFPDKAYLYLTFLHPAGQSTNGRKEIHSRLVKIYSVYLVRKGTIIQDDIVSSSVHISGKQHTKQTCGSNLTYDPLSNTLEIKVGAPY